MKRIDKNNLIDQLRQVFKFPDNIISIEPNDWMNIYVDATSQSAIKENQNHSLNFSTKIWLDFMLNSTGNVDNELRTFLGNCTSNFSFMIGRTINKIANERADIQYYSKIIYNTILREPKIKENITFGPLFEKFGGKSIGKKQLKKVATKLESIKSKYNDMANKVAEQVSLTVSTKYEYLAQVNLEKQKMEQFTGIKGTLWHLSVASDITNNLKQTQNGIMGALLEISSILDNYNALRFKWATFLMNL